MASNSVNLGLGAVAGHFYHAVASAEIVMPTYPKPNPTGFANAGYISSDGPTWTPFGSQEVLRAWDNTAVRTFSSEKGTVTIPVISTDEESLKAVFGSDRVTVTAATSEHGKLVTVNTEDGPSSEKHAIVLLGKDGDDALMLSCPEALITEIGEVAFAPDGAITWEITLEGDWTFVKDDGQKTASV